MNEHFFEISSWLKNNNKYSREIYVVSSVIQQTLFNPLKRLRMK